MAPCQFNLRAERPVNSERRGFGCLYLLGIFYCLKIPARRHSQWCRKGRIQPFIGFAREEQWYAEAAFVLRYVLQAAGGFDIRNA